MNRRTFVACLLAVLALPSGVEARGRKKDRVSSGDRAPRRPRGSGGGRSGGGGGGTYRNCTEARDAGAAPIREGDEGYSRKLDRDGDGIACE